MTSTGMGDAGMGDAPKPHAAYSALIGLTTLVILLQGVWAGVFLQHDGERDAASGWITVHSIGASLSVLLAIGATVVAFVKLRERRDLVVGTTVLAGLLIVETALGNLIESSDAMTVVHVPLAMLIMGLAVWLPVRARTIRSTT